MPNNAWCTYLITKNTNTYLLQLHVSIGFTDFEISSYYLHNGMKRTYRVVDDEKGKSLWCVCFKNAVLNSIQFQRSLVDTISLFWCVILLIIIITLPALSVWNWEIAYSLSRKMDRCLSWLKYVTGRRWCTLLVVLLFSVCREHVHICKCLKQNTL